MMKTRKLVVITSLVLVSLIIATGVIFAQGMGAVNQGTDSTAEGDFSTVSGGRNNNIPAEGDFATIGGGENNTAEGSHDTIGGGDGNAASGGASTVGGGNINRASGEFATIGGGREHNASNFFATVAGGNENTATGFSATIAGGGPHNVASGAVSTVSGGELNSASGDFAAVGGGSFNDAGGDSSTVPGGRGNSASGDFSFATGRRAQANHNGTFVWADATDKDFTSTGENQFLIRASGGVGIGTNNPREQLTVNGKVLAKAFVRHSAAQWKTDIQTLEGSLEKVQNLRGVSYDWKADGKHDIGLIAEEVGKVIPEVVVYEENGEDAVGVDYAGLVPMLIESIKEQQQLLEDRDARIAAQQQQIVALQARVTTLEESVGAEAKGGEPGQLPFSTPVMLMMVGSLGLLLVTSALLLGYHRFRRDE